MRGFIRNETGQAVFKLQRPLPVRGVLSFDDAYLTLGEKSGKKEGPAFVKWLKENHFQDEGWVFYKEDGVPYFPQDAKEATAEVPETAPPKVAPAKGAGKRLKKNSRPRKKEITAASIIEAEFPQAKALIEKCNDRGTLKKAETLSNHFANKEEHRRHILRRLEQVY